jgi:hypothetical protein
MSGTKYPCCRVQRQRSGHGLCPRLRHLDTHRGAVGRPGFLVGWQDDQAERRGSKGVGAELVERNEFRSTIDLLSQAVQVLVRADQDVIASDGGAAVEDAAVAQVVGGEQRSPATRSARVSDPAETNDRRSPATGETFGRFGGSVGRPATWRQEMATGPSKVIPQTRRSPGSCLSALRRSGRRRRPSR